MRLLIICSFLLILTGKISSKVYENHRTVGRNKKITVIKSGNNKKTSKLFANNEEKSNNLNEAKQILNPPIADPSLPFYVSLAKLAYCPQKTIKTLSCSFCDKLVGYATYYVHSIKDDLGRRFKFSILYNDLRTEVVLTFSGPTSEQGDFFNTLYTQGFIVPPDLKGAGIEAGYWLVYNEFIRPELISKLQALTMSNRGHYRYIFVGHSFGGSIAVLSAFDMFTKGLLPIPPLIYTYGQLRIGDLNFVSLINSTLQIIKVVKYNDYLTRIPNCLFIEGGYRCSHSPVMMASTLPGLDRYFSGYMSPRAMNPNAFAGTAFGPSAAVIRSSFVPGPFTAPILEEPAIPLGTTFSRDGKVYEADDVHSPLQNNSRVSNLTPGNIKENSPLGNNASSNLRTEYNSGSNSSYRANSLSGSSSNLSFNKNEFNHVKDVTYRKAEINSGYVNGTKQDKYVASTSNNNDSSIRNMVSPGNLESTNSKDNFSSASNFDNNSLNNSPKKDSHHTGNFVTVDEVNSQANTNLKFVQTKERNKIKNRIKKSKKFVSKGKINKEKIVVTGSTVVGDRMINTISQTNPLPPAPFSSLDPMTPYAPLRTGPPIGTAVLRRPIPAPLPRATVPFTAITAGITPYEPVGLRSPLMVPNLSTFYSQPYGIEFFLGNGEASLSPCNYESGIPSCERDMALPNRFPPSSHKYYFKTNVEFCR